MLTASGQDYRLAGPMVLLGNAPSIQDIAHHLAIINRYTGATSRPYSVAEHSLFVERLADARGASVTARMACLMHDAHEAYVSDMTSPAKSCLGTAWIGFEALHSANVRQHFSLKTSFASHRALVKTCDVIALATERRDLTAYVAGRNDPWPILDTPGREVLPDAARIDPDEPPLSWRAMRQAFIDKYLLLRELVDARARELNGAPA
jgi:hypothetical protein